MSGDKKKPCLGSVLGRASYEHGIMALHMTVIKHVVHVHMAVVHLDAGMVHSVVHMMQDMVMTGKGVRRENEGEGNRNCGDPGGLHGRVPFS